MKARILHTEHAGHETYFALPKKEKNVSITKLSSS